jgi:hypothetical protein
MKPSTTDQIQGTLHELKGKKRAHPRAWHSPRAGSDQEDDSADDSAPGIGAGDGGRGAGTRWRADRVALDGGTALWSVAHRSSYVCGSNACAHLCGACGQLYSGDESNAGRSAGGVALGEGFVGCAARVLLWLPSGYAGN